ncbi:MAG: DUF4367 domain-containing protein [Vulcanibacillus sp.]
MFKRKYLLILLAMMLILMSGCGQKSSEDIIGDLEANLETLKSYKAVGAMTIESGESPQEYNVEVWYKQPDYYRIALSNINTNVTQIILKNNEGVFVLEPSLNKSYRFKSDWPESNGAVYLFHSLVSSIIDDKERLFSTEEDFYIYEVKANYENKTLSMQKIWLDKDLRPIKVLVFDPNQTKLVEIVFNEFEFDCTFDDDAFSVERNLVGWDLNLLPVFANNEESNFGIIEPAYLPDGLTKNTPKIIRNDNGTEIVIKYTGEYNFNLIESRSKAIMASAPEMSQTDIVDLGYGIGLITEMNEIRTLAWTYNGVDFKLTGDLPTDEMVIVAKSVIGQTGK